jgi:apolipoprotein N-acyltransferase
MLSERPARHLLALGGGFLVAVSLPPWGFWPLAVIGVMCLEIALGERPGRLDRFLRGFLFGAAWLYMGMGWMWQLTVPGYLVAGAVFASFHGVAALVAPTGRWRTIGRPAAHTLVEALRLSFPFGGVPLATMGISQAAGPLLGTARLGGVVLMTWIVFQLGMSLAGPAPAVPRVLRRRRPGASGAPHGVVGLAAVALAVLLAAVAPAGTGTGQWMTVAAVQGGGEQGTRARDVPSSMVFRRHLEVTRTIAPDPELDLVLWPENVIDVDDEPFVGSEQQLLVAGEAARLGVPFSVGVTEDADVTGMGTAAQTTNAQIVVTPDGEVTSRYDKVRRVPFGEYVPLRTLLETLGAPVDQVPTNAVPGDDPAINELPDGTTIGVVISWEVFFGGRARDGVKSGGELIVNPTNGASYTGTILQTQQVASSRLRAVETGRWLVQAAPTGFSEFVTPGGDVLQRTAVSEQRVITGEVELRTGRTWYVRLGDAPFILATAATLALAMAMARRRPGPATNPGPPAAGPSDLEQHRDRPVVDELDAHLGAEAAAGDGRASVP